MGIIPGANKPLTEILVVSKNCPYGVHSKSRDDDQSLLGTPRTRKGNSAACGLGSENPATGNSQGPASVS